MMFNSYLLRLLLHEFRTMTKKKASYFCHSSSKLYSSRLFSQIYIIVLSHWKSFHTPICGGPPGQNTPFAISVQSWPSSSFGCSSAHLLQFSLEFWGVPSVQKNLPSSSLSLSPIHASVFIASDGTWRNVSSKKLFSSSDSIVTKWPPWSLHEASALSHVFLSLNSLKHFL